MSLSLDLTANEEVGGWGKNFTDTELDSDERRGHLWIEVVVQNDLVVV